MNRIGHYVVYLCAILWLAVVVQGCGEKTITLNNSKPYTVVGKLSSAKGTDHIIMLADNHESLSCDTVLLTSDGSFSYTNRTEDVAELYMHLGKDTVYRFYAQAGAACEIQTDSVGNISFEGKDSINNWLQMTHQKLLLLSKSQVEEYVDSLSRADSLHVRSIILLREEIELLSDSVHVRRCMGNISQQAKPEWVVDDIEAYWSKKYRSLRKNKRMAVGVFQPLDEENTYNLRDSRQNSLLMYFWAEEDAASVDSLSVMDELAKEYGLYDYQTDFVKKNKKPKRLEIISFCLGAKDSTSWKTHIRQVPGKHVLLQTGYADRRIQAWNVQKTPFTIVLDRFSNIQEFDVWGDALTKVLDKTPYNSSVVKQTNSVTDMKIKKLLRK